MPTLMTMTLGEKLKELRTARGWTLEDMAQAAGMPSSSYTKIEQGKVGNPKWETMRKLAKALEVSIADLETDEPPEGESEERPKPPRGRPRKKKE